MANDVSQNFGTFASAASSFSPYVGAATDFVSNVSSGLFGANQARKNRKAQARENQANREFNEKMMHLQNQFAVENWERENAYNTPSAQMARMKAAGVNPDLYFSDGLTNSSMGIASPTAAASSGSVGSAPGNFQGSDFLGAALAQATVSNLNADTRKTNAEASIYETDAKFREAWNSLQIEEGNMRIRLGDSAKDLNEQQVNESQAKVRNLNANSDSIMQSIIESRKRCEVLDEEKKIKATEAYYKSSEYEALIGKLHAEAQLSRQQATQIATMLPLMVSNMAADTLVKHKTALKIHEDTLNAIQEGYILTVKEGNLRLQNDRLEFDLTQDKTYSDIERSLDIFDKACDRLQKNIKAPIDCFLDLLGVFK